MLFLLLVRNGLHSCKWTWYVKVGLHILQHRFLQLKQASISITLGSPLLAEHM